MTIRQAAEILRSTGVRVWEQPGTKPGTIRRRVYEGTSWLVFQDGYRHGAWESYPLLVVGSGNISGAFAARCRETLEAARMAAEEGGK